LEEQCVTVLSFSLGWSGEHFQEGFDVALDLRFLLVSESKAGKEQLHVLSACIDDSGGNAKRLCPESFSDLLSGHSSNAMTFQQRPELRQAQSFREVRHRSHLEQVPKPTVVVDASDRENLREIPVKLLTESVGKGNPIRFQLVMHSAELAQFDEQWFANPDASKRCHVGTQRIGEHQRIPPVVLGTGYRVSIAKAIELFRVDRKDGYLLLEQRFDDRPSRYLDRSRNLFDATVGESQHRPDELAEPCARMRVRRLEEHFSLRVDHAHLMRLRAPVDPDKY
jgi:hypothetical protein